MTRPLLSTLGGVVHSVRSMAGPSGVDEIAPTHSGRLYLDRARRGTRPRVDVYLPPGDGPHPSVLLVHGGGFVIGHRRMKPMRILAARLVAEGYAVASLDYRKVFRGGRVDASLADVAACSAWWRSRAETFDLDLDRVAMLGISAGAALTLLHGAASPGDFHRLVALYGPYDFTQLAGSVARILLQTSDPEDWLARSPVSVFRADVPTLLVHGTADRVTPRVHLDRMLEAAEAAGAPVEALVLEGEEHAFLNEPWRPAARRTLERLLDFLGG